MKQTSYSRQSAESLALRAVAFLAADDDHIQRFIASTGLDPATFARNVDDSTTLAGVLDFILGDENLVIEFSEFAGITPEEPAIARQALPGFQHW